MALYYVETGLGCNLIEARTEDDAKKQTLREVGTYVGVQRVREATKDDINWVRAMQGGQTQ